MKLGSGRRLSRCDGFRKSNPVCTMPGNNATTVPMGIIEPTSAVSSLKPFSTDKKSPFPAFGKVEVFTSTEKSQFEGELWFELLNCEDSSIPSDNSAVYSLLNMCINCSEIDSFTYFSWTCSSQLETSDWIEINSSYEGSLKLVFEYSYDFKYAADLRSKSM